MGGTVKGPLAPEVGGVTTAPVVELTKIGGFKPVTKPEADFADLTGRQTHGAKQGLALCSSGTWKLQSSICQCNSQNQSYLESGQTASRVVRARRHAWHGSLDWRQEIIRGKCRGNAYSLLSGLWGITPVLFINQYFGIHSISKRSAKRTARR